MWGKRKKEKLSIEEHVKQIISEVLGQPIKKIIPQANLVEDLEADSLDTVELLMAFEDEFDMEIPDADGLRIKTVGDALKYLQEKL